MITVKCPHCETITDTNKKWVECDVCGNGYKAKNNEVGK